MKKTNIGGGPGKVRNFPKTDTILHPKNSGVKVAISIEKYLSSLCYFQD